MKELWANLSDSERRTALIASVVLGLMLSYALIWDPLMSGVEKRREAAQQQRELVAWMQDAVAQVKALQRARGSGATSPRGGQSLLAVVDQTARREKLGEALNRVEPKGQDEVRVRLENASFDDMIKWLSKLQSTYGVVIDSVAVDRQPQPGRVSANLTLKEGAP